MEQLREPEQLRLFETPVFIFDLADGTDGADGLNQELSSRLRHEAQTQPGIKRSNAGGWHSVPDLTLRADSCFQEVTQAVVHHVGLVVDKLATDAGIETRPPLQYGAQAWAMVMNDGDYTVLHNHVDAHWSVVYYVDAGESDEEQYPQSGQICFVDPRRDVNTIPGIDLFPSALTVRPKTGMLLLFPGWIQHYVHPFRGKGPRICMAYNVTTRLAPPT